MQPSARIKLNLVASLVFLSGAITLWSILLSFLHAKNLRIVVADARLTVIAGISLVYLATLLKRGKYNAWLIAIGVYGFLIVRNIEHYIIDHRPGHRIILAVINITIPVLTITLLLSFKKLFRVKSEPRSFVVATKRSALIISIAFIYGVVGFQLFDRRDFNQEISLPAAAHFTVDQFGLTTQKELVANTKRGVFFVDSLAAISVTSLVYVGIAFFSPIRFKLTHRDADTLAALEIAKKKSKTSEDFFKFWPKDKAYFLNEQKTAFLAYRVVRSVALVVGDPIGSDKDVYLLIKSFCEYCRLNDWAIAFIHTDGSLTSLYNRLDFDEQKIGEEAIVDVDKFIKEVAGNKYFRHINNKFTKQGYKCELVSPPFSDELFNKISKISEDWLKQPGRAERGFMLGYFSRDYMNQCKLMLAYDESGNIKAFINQIPSLREGEASYDFLRQSNDSLGNINDYLMVNFIRALHDQGYRQLNMGLCPLSGLSAEDEKDRGLMDGVLNFVYSNAGRFYSFQGLRRFKSKYEPDWQPRYIVYRGGLPGLTRSANALLRAMTHYNSWEKHGNSLDLNAK